MSKAVLMSIQPYWGFLIIAKAKGWDLKKYGLHEKTVEVRKNAHKDPEWNKTTELYFSKDKKSLARIPEEYRKEVETLCGKVVAKFTCNQVERFTVGSLRSDDIEDMACVSFKEICEYFYKPGECDGRTAKEGCAWHISDIKIYDQPKELSEFVRYCNKKELKDCLHCKNYSYFLDPSSGNCFLDDGLTRPPQSWCYVEEI